MPRGPAPEWRKRKEPIVDDYLLASISQAGGKYDEAGRYAELVIRGLATRDEAAEYKKSLHRCAYFMHRNGIASISVSSSIERDGKNWAVRFATVNKAHAYQYMLAKYGTDRSKWPYNPRGRAAQ